MYAVLSGDQCCTHWSWLVVCQIPVERHQAVSVHTKPKRIRGKGICLDSSRPEFDPCFPGGASSRLSNTRDFRLRKGTLVATLPGAWHNRSALRQVGLTGWDGKFNAYSEEEEETNLIMIMMIALKGAIWDFYNLLTAPRAVSSKYAQAARVQSCANYMQHIKHLSHAMSCATWNEGTAQQLSLTEFKSHLF